MVACCAGNVHGRTVGQKGMNQLTRWTTKLAETHRHLMDCRLAVDGFVAVAVHVDTPKVSRAVGTHIGVEQGER